MIIFILKFVLRAFMLTFTAKLKDFVESYSLILATAPFQDSITIVECDLDPKEDLYMLKSLPRIQLGVVTRSLRVFSGSDRRKLYLIIFLNTVTGFIDLIAIALIGVLAALALNGENSKISKNIVTLFNQIILREWKLSQVISVIAAATAILFFIKTILSIKFTQRIMHFLSSRAAKLSSTLVASLLTKPITSLENKTSHETLYLITRGVEVVALHILATFFMLVSDIFLILIIFVLIFLVDPLTAVLTALVFGTIGFFLDHFVHSKASRLGSLNTGLNIASNEAIMEVFQSYRELIVGNRRSFYVNRISQIRSNLAFTSAELSFMPYISKYTIEITVLFSAILISGSQFILNGSASAIQTLAIFLGAGSRLAPAVLRIQQSILQIKASDGMANSTLSLIESLDMGVVAHSEVYSMQFTHSDFNPRIQVSDVTYTYPSNDQPSLYSANLTIDAGQHIAIVGPSGAGKSTLVDIILGIITPDSGKVSISDVEPLEAFSRWPGATSYVPQKIFISSATVRENIALGYDASGIPEKEYLRAIRSAVLGDYISSLDFGLDTEVGEHGGKMSGGQRQRLGIARAMVTNATSTSWAPSRPTCGSATSNAWPKPAWTATPPCPENQAAPAPATDRPCAV